MTTVSERAGSVHTELHKGNTSPLGATVCNGGVNFSVFARDCTGIELLLFDRADDTKASKILSLVPKQNRTYHYWHTFVPDIGSGQLYGYRVAGPFDPQRGMRFDPDKLLIDPYGRAVAVPSGYDRGAACAPGDNVATSMKSVVADPRGYDWEGDMPLKRAYSQTIIYEMHVSGFTKHPSSGVPADKRGTYAGLIEKIPYLQDLGVTAIELLPIFQFDPHDAPSGLVNYWGYRQPDLVLRSPRGVQLPHGSARPPERVPRHGQSAAPCRH